MYTHVRGEIRSRSTGSGPISSLKWFKLADIGHFVRVLHVICAQKWPFSLKIGLKWLKIAPN